MPETREHLEKIAEEGISFDFIKNNCKTIRDVQKLTDEFISSIKAYYEAKGYCREELDEVLRNG